MKDVKFQLDIMGGANVLQIMSKDLIDKTANKIAGKCRNRTLSDGIDVSFKVKNSIGAPNKRGGQRYFSRIEIESDDKHEKFKARESHIIEKSVASTKIY